MPQEFTFEKYRNLFDEYAGHYDKADGRIELKIIHTNSVVSIMDMLCKKRNLPEHTARLAMLCALFHDIGRFEQLKQYDTFLDHESCDHAELSCLVLKKHQMLAGLSKADQNKVLTAIANHNRYEIAPETVAAAMETRTFDTKECLELCKLIRDADKCDIFRVFAIDDMTDVVGAPEEEIAKETITPAVRQAILDHRCVDKLIRKTYLDFWISFLGFFFDLNYPESMGIARSQGYYRMPFDRTDFTNSETRAQIDEILAEIEQYIDGIIRPGDAGPLADAGSLTDTGSLANAGQADETIPERLRNFFSIHKDIALAFSGGTDSAYLLYTAVQCGCNVHAYYVSTPFQPQFELDDAKRLTEELNAAMTVLPFDVLALDDVRRNPADRCYYCKNGIFHLIMEAAAKDGYKEIMDGTNASDDAGDRPGMRALRELKVLSPLRECGVTKKALREYSRNAGLFTWNKPAYACLATRIPTNVQIEKEMLKKIEAAENRLTAMGFSDFRVRVIPEPSVYPGTTVRQETTVHQKAAVRQETAPAQEAPIPAVSAKTAPAVSYTAKLQVTDSQLPLLMEKRQELLEFLNGEFSSVLLDLNTRTSSVMLPVTS